MVVSLSKGIPEFALHEIVIFRQWLFSADLPYPAIIEDESHRRAQHGYGWTSKLIIIA